MDRVAGTAPLRVLKSTPLSADAEGMRKWCAPEHASLHPVSGKSASEAARAPTARPGSYNAPLNLIPEPTIPMHRSIRSTLLTAVLAAGALAVGGAPAAASDATLRGEIQTVLVELRPALVAFQEAAEELETAKDTTQLQAATQGVRNGLSRYKWGVVNRKASTRGGLAAKKRLLDAIRRYDVGFVQFEKALERIDAGASNAAVVSSLRKAIKGFDAGLKAEQAALKALGVVEPA